jgi:hypothetical protein
VVPVPRGAKRDARNHFKVKNGRKNPLTLHMKQKNSFLQVGVRQHAMSEGKCAGMQEILSCLGTLCNSQAINGAT